MVPSIVFSLILSGALAVNPATPARNATIAAAPMQARFFAGSPFISKPGRFSITLPAGYTKPKLETQEVPSDLGKITLYMHTAIGDSGVCLIGYSDISNVDFTAELRDKMLEGAKEGALENMHATLDGEENISLDGNPGRSMRFTANNSGQAMHGRFDYFMVGNRLYQIGFIALTADGLTTDQVAAYFKSFKITKAKK